MRRAIGAMAALGLVLSLAPACGKAKANSAGATAAGGATELIAAWKSAGLKPSAFAITDGSKLGGGSCRAGTIDGLDATVCEYADAASAQRAERAGLALVGDATGTALASGNLLVVVADRHKADPEGKRINLVTNSFRHRK